MSNIIIIGSSPAEARIIEEIRANDKESKITMFCIDGQLPYDRQKVPSYLSNEIGIEDLRVKQDEFYQQHNVELITDEKITRINVKRKKVHTEKKLQLDYDVLLIGDTPDKRFTELKGSNKNGVHGLSAVGDIKKIYNYIPLIDTAIIQSDSMAGFQVAAALVKRDREVLLVSSKGGMLSEIFSDERLGNVIESLEQKGLRLLINNGINEILGEGEVKAVRLESGKVLAVQMAILSSQNCDLRFFGEGLTIKENKIQTDEAFDTDDDSVYAYDKVSTSCLDSMDADELPSLDTLDRQGRRIVKNLKGEQWEGEEYQYERSVQIDDFSLHILGDCWLEFGIEKKEAFDEEARSFERLFIKDGLLKGAVLINGGARVEALRDALGKEFHIKVEPVREELEGGEDVQQAPLADPEPVIKEEETGELQSVVQESGDDSQRDGA